MTNIKVLFVTGTCVLFSAGCSSAGTTTMTMVPGSLAGAPASSGAKAGTAAPATGTAGNPAPTTTSPTPPASMAAGQAVAGAAAAVGAAAGATSVAGTGAAGTAATAGTGAAGTSAAAAGGAAPVAGTAAPSGAAGATAAAGAAAAAGASAAGTAAPLPPCPTGWECANPAQPLMDFGIADGKVTDDKGAPVDYACGNGGLVTCDMADPKGSCPELSQPFCAHVSIPSMNMDIYSCAQHCEP